MKKNKLAAGLLKSKASITHYLLWLVLAIPYSSIAQDAQGQAPAARHKGRVVSSRKEAIPYVTISTMAGAVLSVSDTAGYFEVTGIADSVTLQATCVGYQTRKFSLKNPFLQIEMSEAAGELADAGIVSTGYQEIARERGNGSFARISNEMLNRQTGTSILKRLDGMASGLQFNIGRTGNNISKTGIMIRGLGTINGPLDPLIVLDGFIYDGDINNINPNDVEQVTLLKDATAASIWGAKAGNGVIVISTKKGSPNRKPEISLATTIISNAKPDLYQLPQISPSDLVDIEQLAFSRGFFNNMINNPYLPLPPAVEVFLMKRRGMISAADSASRIDALKDVDSREQYSRYAYTQALTQQYSATVRGGGPQTSYLFSAAYDHNLGELHNTYGKINLHSDNTYQVSRSLKISAGLYYTSSESGSGRPAYNSIRINNRQVGYLALADPDGNPMAVSHIYRSSYTDTVGGGLLQDWKYYPLEDYKHDRTAVKGRELFANAGIQYRFSKLLNLDIRYQYQDQETVSRQYSDEESFSARSLVNQFSQLDRQAGLVKYIVGRGGTLTQTRGTVSSYTGRSQLNFHLKEGPHEVTAIAGVEIRQSRAESTRFTLVGYQEDPLSYVPADYMNTYPVITGGYQQVGNGPSASLSGSRFISGYFNGSYSFSDRYSVSASARRDGSNIFGSRTNDRWKPLWSAGAGWWLSREPFYRLLMVPSLRLRATYGVSGNIDPSMTAVAVGSYIASNTGGFRFARVQKPANAGLTWEQSAILNLAADFSLKDRALSGSLEFYWKKGTNLYGPGPYDYTAWGFSRDLVSNVANMKGMGADILLSGRAGQSVVWEGTLIFSYNTSKTTKYFNASSANIATKLGAGTGISPVVGKPLYAMAAYRWAGLDSLGNPMGYLNGVPSTDYTGIVNEGLLKGIDGNIVYIGPSNPTVSGTLTNTMRWKGLSLSACLSYRMGYYFRRPPISYSSLITSGAGHPDYYLRWQRPGDEAFTDIPSFVYPNNTRRDNFYSMAEINMLKGDHIRLQYINLSYEPVSRKKPSFRQLEVFLNIANLGILWRANDAGADPDYPLALRPTRSISAGFRCTL